VLRHDHHTHLWPHRAGTPLPAYDELARRCEIAARAGVEVVAGVDEEFHTALGELRSSHTKRRNTAVTHFHELS